jgi:hypothetical protein
MLPESKCVDMISVSESTWLSHSKLMEGKTSASHTSSSVNGGKLKSFICNKLYSTMKNIVSKRHSTFYMFI